MCSESIFLPKTTSNRIPGAQYSAAQNITIPNSVTHIGSSAFMGCTSLKKITIPISATWISDKAFNFCKSLLEIKFLGDAPNVGEDVFNDSSPIIYRKPEAKGWGDTWGGRPVKLISEKP